MAAKNFGAMEKMPVEIEPIYMFQVDEDAEPIMIVPGRTAIVMGKDGVTWWDMVKNIRVKDGQWFIAVDDAGYIMCCEPDPNKVFLFDIDIWQINHPGPREAIFCQRWTGKEVVPWVES